MHGGQAAKSERLSNRVDSLIEERNDLRAANKELKVSLIKLLPEEAILGSVVCLRLIQPDTSNSNITSMSKLPLMIARLLCCCLSDIVAAEQAKALAPKSASEMRMAAAVAEATTVGFMPSVYRLDHH